MNIKPKILVIADDLTGCGDVGYWGIDYDFSQTILNDCCHPELVSGSKREKMLKQVQHDSFFSDVTLINTNSRLDSPETAYKKVKQIATWAITQNFDFIFKKMDSTLKGNWISENDALIEVFDLKNLPVVAAYLEYERITKNGVHFVFGKEIAHIPTMIKNQSKYPDKMVSYDLVAPSAKIYAGTSWFFGQILAQKYQQKPKKVQQKKYEKIIIVAGSMTEITRKQIDGLTDIEVIKSPDFFVPNYDLKDLTKQLKIAKNTLIICCGGETAMAVCEELDIRSLNVRQKIATGIVLCEADNLDLILKSGGFGDEDFFKKLFCF